MVRNLLLAILAAVVLAASVFYVLANHSITTNVFACEERGGPHRRIHMSMDLYRPWVLWTNSLGYMHVEMPDGFLLYFSELRDAGKSITIFEDRNGTVPDGWFSRISGHLNLSTGLGMIDATCVPGRGAEEG